VGETRGEWVLAERRQVVDVTVHTKVTEHQLWRRSAPKPGIPRILSAELLPAEATASVAFHPHVRAMALFLGQSVTVPDRWVARTHKGGDSEAGASPASYSSFVDSRAPSPPIRAGGKQHPPSSQV
jgi:hypothetical protein